MNLYYRVIATRVPIFGRTDSSTLRLGVEFFEWVLCPLSDDGQDRDAFLRARRLRLDPPLSRRLRAVRRASVRLPSSASSGISASARPAV